MVVRLNVTMESALYERLKRELPPKKISSFIADAVRARLRPDARSLAAGYKAARAEAWRGGLSTDWDVTETDGWPE